MSTNNNSNTTGSSNGANSGNKSNNNQKGNNFSNKNKNNNMKKKNFKKKSTGYSNSSTSNKFKGREEALKGHIYDCSNIKQADVFIKTTKEIAEYVGRTYKYGGDIKLTLENL